MLARYHQHWIPFQPVPLTLDIAQKVPPILNTAQKGTAYTQYRPKRNSFSFRVRSLFFVFSGCSGFFSVEPLCGRVDRNTPPHLLIYLPTRLPTPRAAWSSRTTSGLEGNPRATSNGVVGSATSSSVEAGSTASSGPGSDNPVDGSESTVLQPPRRAETTIRGGGNRRITVTLEQPVSGKRKLIAWCSPGLSTTKMLCAWSTKLRGLPAVTS